MNSRLFLIGLVGWLVSAAHLAAAEPVVTRLTPPALLSTGTSKIVIEGNNLGEAIQLIAPFTISSQKVIGTAQPKRVELEVTLADTTPAGLYPLRISTADGISAAQIVSIDQIATVPFTDKIDSLPIALAGELPGSQILRTTFEGKKDQALVLEVEAQRLGSKLNPTVRLYDPHGSQLVWSPPRDEAGGDARCETTLPHDGVYQIELHDHLYKGAAPAHFRLKIGSFKYAGAMMPLAIQVGSKAQVQPLLANSDQHWEVAPQTKIPGELGIPLPIEGASGAQPRLMVSDLPEYADPFPADMKAPCGISAFLAADGKEQTHRLQVQPGKKLRFDLRGHQLGSPIDAVLTIRKEQGGQLGTNDDRPDSRDPYLEVDIPADVSTIVAAVKDLSGKSGPDYFYRLEVRQADAPVVTATLDAAAIQLPAGGTQVFVVPLERQNYNGPLVVEVNGLPSGVTLQGNEIGAGAPQALLGFQATDAASGSGVISLNLRAADNSFVRHILLGNQPAAKTMPWLRYEAGFAVVKPAPIQIVWQPPSQSEMVGGTSVASMVTIARQPDVKGQVRLRLVTTQPMPRKKVKENNQDKEVDDTDRALRLADMPTLAEDATTSEVKLLVPIDLPVGDWDLALIAELLSADGKNVVATNASAVHRFHSVAPFKLELVSEPKGEGRAGLGDATSLVGKIQRAAGFNNPVSVTLTGLPKNVVAPIAVVPGDQSEFSLPLKFPYGTKPGEVKDVKLVALADGTGNTPPGSNALPIALTIVAGEKPPAEEPLVIFDENADFVSQLSQGGGNATVEQNEKYSGKIAVKVTPDQKFNPALPGLNLKIRENPGPGEYRYLRFAWKKNGGDTICLQLNHDGQWGPTAETKPGAKFRYHAGPADEQYTASLEVANTIPGDFEVVTRDLFADFGEFTLTGLALSPVDGSYAVFDHLYLGRSQDDFSLAKTDKE